MGTESDGNMDEFGHLSDREIMLLIARDVKSLKGLNPRVSSLESWRTALSAAWVTAIGLGAAVLRYAPGFIASTAQAAVEAKGRHP